MSADAEAAITAYLNSKGQRPLVIRRLWFSWKVIFGRGLSNMATGYRVTATSDDGATNTYVYACDPIGFSVFERSGLKRFSNGVWFDAI
ncbi:MAG: hypothetical protein JWM33_1547 [Caulobacteraceae bacterium]|nr:hypothetical protein [Caulobacteraceae bacterium]